jgi:hypothetical protein
VKSTSDILHVGAVTFIPNCGHGMSFDCIHVCISSCAAQNQGVEVRAADAHVWAWRWARRGCRWWWR